MNILTLLLCVVKIGIVTDTHIEPIESREGRARLDRLERAYRLFKAHGVTNIFNVGDIANTYKPASYAGYVKVRERVYPEGVDEVFVYHNHDRMYFPDDDAKSERAFAAVQRNLGAKNGRYHSFTLGGCRFLVYPMFSDLKRQEAELAAACRESPGKPVFVLDHVPPSDTIDGSNAGGSGATRRLYEKYPQAVVLTGHVHGSLAHEGKIWQGGFTVMGFGAIKDPVAPEADIHVAIMELGEQQAVIRRYALSNGAELRPETPWTLTFPYDPKNPRYAPARRAKELPAPAFAPAAAVSATRDSKAPGTLKVSFPAVANPDWLDHFRVTVFTNGVDHAAVETGWGEFAKPRKSVRFGLTLDASYFEGTDRATIVVTPIGLYGNEGAPIRCEADVSGLGAEVGWKTVYSSLPKGVKSGKFNKKGHFPLPDEIWNRPEGTQYRLVLDLAQQVKGTGILQMQVLHPKPKERLSFGKVAFRPTNLPQRLCRFFQAPRAREGFRVEFFNGENRFRLDSFRIDVLEPGAAGGKQAKGE